LIVGGGPADGRAEALRQWDILLRGENVAERLDVDICIIGAGTGGLVTAASPPGSGR
jgi:hypothetical protein